MSIETTTLYQEMCKRAREVPAGPDDLVEEFKRLRVIVMEHSQYIVLQFPEYTPHNHSHHLDNLFALADRVLGKALYTRLSATELVLLAFGLFAHGWSMAVSDSERQSLINAVKDENFAYLPDEPMRSQAVIANEQLTGVSPEVACRNYVRLTHGLRSGARLRRYLAPLGTVFTDTVAKIAEGHMLSLREVRDPDRYPQALSVFGETINIAALTTYVRILDLLDIGDDRTPYTLWTFVAPADPISSLEWKKHRALSPIAVNPGAVLREVLITGHTDDYKVYAALADLRAWIDEQFAGSIAQLRSISGKYDVDLDSRISWNIQAVGFKPLSVRFELDRREILSLLCNELYQGDPLAFIRELLQNSVDAIDMREALLAKHGFTFKGEIRVSLVSDTTGLSIQWNDNGIGMDEEVFTAYFARPGQCWYRSLEANKLAKIDAISRFGVGVLSFFAVSESLIIETQRDPLIGEKRPGLIVEIPSRESHFRIRIVTDSPVGTTLRLKIPPLASEKITMESIYLAIKRISRFVRHNIIIECNGIQINSDQLVKTDITGNTAPLDSGPEQAIVGMQGDSAKFLGEMTKIISFWMGECSGDYYGFYSAIQPILPSEVSETDDYKVVIFGDKRVDFEDIVVTNREEALFVKGIKTGSVGHPHTRSGDVSNARESNWIRPSFLLNIQRPSKIEFNLARSSAHLKSQDYIRTLWQEIALKLRTSVYSWPLTNASDSALLLGSCAYFGKVPDYGLDALVEANECPLLVLRAGNGPIWITLSEFTKAEEFIEVPFEAAYASYFNDYIVLGQSIGFEGWEGEDSLFPLQKIASKRYPWLESVIAFGYRALARNNWHPSAIRLIRQPENETVPLVCRVWRNTGSVHPNIAYDDEIPTEGFVVGMEQNTIEAPYPNAPEVLQFPLCMSKYAALGSRYWNIEHPKIKTILGAFINFREWRRLHRMSDDNQLEFSFLMSRSFAGYIVPSRYAPVKLALELPNRLLDIAMKEGVPCTERLVPEEFVPGTIGKYQNPYKYDIKKWREQGMGLGKRID